MKKLLGVGLLSLLILNPSRSFAQQPPVSTDTTKALEKGSKLSSKEVRKIEKAIQKNPNDLNKRIELLSYYQTESNRSKKTKKQMRKAFDEQALWIIENHPEVKVSLWMSSSSDGAAYDQAKTLWVKQVDKNRKNVQVVSNAALFFWLADKDLAIKYYRECVDLDPKNPEWHGWLANLYQNSHKKSKDEQKALKKKALEEDEKAITFSKDDEKTRFLDSAAEVAFEIGELKKAQQYAEEFLELSKLFDKKKKFKYGINIEGVNIVLGKMALQSGDLKKADDYLLAAGDIPGFEAIEYIGVDIDLAEELLAKGEKDAVIRYFQECTLFWKKDGGLLKKWISQVKNGEKPEFDERYYVSDPEMKKIWAAEKLKWKDIKEGVHWVSYAEAEQALKKGDKPVLYDFSAEWCGPCKRLKQEVFGDKKTADWINKSFTPCMAIDRKYEDKKNPPELERLDKKYSIGAFPTLVIQFPNGKFKSTQGYAGKDEIAQFLKDGLAEFKQAGK